MQIREYMVVVLISDDRAFFNDLALHDKMGLSGQDPEQHSCP